MSFGSLTTAIVLGFCLLSSCGRRAEVNNPTKPASVHGWEAYQAGAITVKGEFVLNKGESANNGVTGLKLVDIYPSKSHLFDSPELPKVKVQFFRVKDQATLCEGVFDRGGNAVDRLPACDSLEWTVLYVRDVNYSEGWAFLDLR